MIITLSLAAIAMGEALEHHVTVDHRGSSVAATYRARVDIDTRTRGIAPPNRPSTQQCAWTANVVVERSLAGAQGEPRAVATDKSLNGTHPGHCETARPAIEKIVAKRSSAIRDRVVAAAEDDRNVLMAELEALRPNG